MDESTIGNQEENVSDSAAKQGGWITFPYTLATLAGLTLAVGGILSNLIVYLIQEFNMKSIDASQIANVVNACTSLVPVVGAIISDSFLGSFSVVLISSYISLLGAVVMTLTAMLDSLRPQPCKTGLCQSPSNVQYAILYAALALVTVGFGGSRFTLATTGATQFEKPDEEGIFFNWYFFTLYLSSVIATIALVYVQENVGWALGFGLCGFSNFIGMAVFHWGSRFYHRDKPRGSPFTGLARVVVATLRKWKVPLPSGSENYYHGQDGADKNVFSATNKSLRFLHRAALKTGGDLNPDGSIAKPWRLCTVQLVEDLKTVMRIFPLWSTSIFLSTPIAILSSLTILQALTMDRHLGQHFIVPAASFQVVILISTAIFLTLIDRFLFPLWKKVRSKPPKPLQRIGVGHLCTILSMTFSALVESKRLRMAHAHVNQVKSGSTVPMSALWLFPQLAVVGIGEAFHFPGQVTLYYQEFPDSLRNTATVMVSLTIAVAYYLSTALIDLLRRTTSWLPDNINDGRLDNVYWLLVGVGLLNFGFYLACAKLYRYQNVDRAVAAAA